jgi:hypothetical protein
MGFSEPGSHLEFANVFPESSKVSGQLFDEIFGFQTGARSLLKHSLSPRKRDNALLKESSDS